MRERFLLLLFSVFLTSLNAEPQQASRFELFGGYSYTSYSVFNLETGPWNRYGFNGWDASAAVKTERHFALEGDFSGGHISSGPNAGPASYNLSTYMGGPRVFGDFGKVGVYGHLLLGGLTFRSGSPNNTGTTFATAFGVGADYWVTRHIGVRLVQADYLENSNPVAMRGGTGVSQPRDNLRIATGVVFRFGH